MCLQRYLFSMKATTKNREIFLGTVAENGNGCGNGCGKTAVFFLVFPAKSFYLCSVKRKNDFSNRSIPTQNKE
ncbi:hypothetical protein DXB41_13030 [Segatella copri]|uniref:Uncharacterized protein n=2 Tax=Segatella copri TaxID=165179 RepID=A0A3E5DTT0_9BACT|nr:hypothetical protein DXB41_13030 [Segatella copri]RHK10908.1 hypothetical protein DW079_06120 [Segatella copri]